MHDVVTLSRTPPPAPQADLTKIFKITALDQTFTILPTRDAAIEAPASANA